MNNDDILGTKAITRIAEKTVDGVGSFLGKICMPAADELGLYFQDHVRAWRAKNVIDIEKKAFDISAKYGGVNGKSAHPLLAWKIIENGSFADTIELQRLWAGLLVSSCCHDASDDSNHIFIDILSQLSIVQVRIIEFGCEQAKKYHTCQKLIQSMELKISLDDLFEISQCNDLQRVDRELDRLRSIGLLSSFSGGINPSESVACITPSPLALHMYARCCGSNENPLDFYKTIEMDHDQIIKEKYNIFS